jgi:hypothetical protein
MNGGPGGSVNIRAGLGGVGTTANGLGGSIFFQTTATTAALSTRLTIDRLGNVAIGTAALATVATDGFLAISTSPGPPTGVPTAYAGRAQIHYDTTNNKLYLNNAGVWKSTAVLT